LKFLRYYFIILLLGTTIGIAAAQTLIWDKPIVSSKALIDSLEGQLNQISNEEKVRYLNILSEAYWQLDANKTILYGQEALSLARQLNLPKEEGNALVNICQGYLFNDSYDQALDYGLKSLAIREKVGDLSDIAFSLRTLGWLYYDIGYLDYALDYHLKVLDIHKKMKDDERIAYSYNSLGLIYAKKKDHVKAISYYKQSLKLKLPFGNKDRISESLKNMGISYAAIGEWALAEENFSRALSIIDETKDYYDLVEVLDELAYIHLQRKNFTLCKSYLDKANVYIDSLSDNKVMKERYSLISSQLYSALNNDNLALHYFQAYDSIKEEILSDEKQYRLAEMRILYEAERRKDELKLLQREKEVESLRKNVLQIGIILVIIIAILIVNRLYSGIRKNKKIFEINQHLSKLKLEKEELESSRLKDRLEYRKKELTNMGLLIAQRNDTFQGLSDALKNFNYLDKEDAVNKIKSLIKSFESKLIINQDIDNFYSDVEHLHDDFFFRLKEKFPNLTDNDLKIAAQLRLKLSSKEISSLNNISVKSVEISRYRLRKKLNLGPNDILADYLNQV